MLAGPELTATSRARLPSANQPVRRNGPGCAAGFFLQADMARARLDELQRRFDLGDKHAVLLTPDDVERQRFKALARRWGRRPATGGLKPLNALAGISLGAAAIGMIGAAWVLAGGSSFIEDEQWPLVLTMMAMGALLGLLLAWRLAVRKRLNRFNNTVRRQLHHGLTAVVVHKVPVGQNKAVLAVLQQGSLKWYAEAVPQAQAPKAKRY